MNNLEQAKKSSAMFYGGIAVSAVVLLLILFFSLYFTQEKSVNQPEIILEHKESTNPKANLENNVELTSSNVLSSNSNSHTLEKASTLTITKEEKDDEAVTEIQVKKPSLDKEVVTPKDGLNVALETITEISERLSDVVSKVSSVVSKVPFVAAAAEKTSLDNDWIIKANEDIALTKKEFVNSLLRIKNIEKKVNLSDITRYIEFTNRKLVEDFLKKAHKGWFFVDSKGYTNSLGLFTKYNLLKDYLKVLNTYSKEEVAKLATSEELGVKESEVHKAKVDLFQLQNFAAFLDLAVDCENKKHIIYFKNFGREVKFFFKNSFTNTFPKEEKHVFGWTENFLPRVLSSANPELFEQSHFDDETYARFQRLKTEVALEISKAVERLNDTTRAYNDAVLIRHFSVSQANSAKAN